MTSTAAPGTTTIAIELQDRSYNVVIGAGLLSHDSDADVGVWSGLPSARSGLIVTNPTVGRLYSDALKSRIARHHDVVHVVALPDGEEFKTWATLNQIFDVLLAQACDRKTVLYALGGGVIGDMTGFAASAYMRGVPFVQVPTTLLAQVDSSVGGKTAINHPLGKNMIGAFYQPQRVICDLDTLKTLPAREISAGLAEVIKYGPIADEAFLLWLESHMEDLVALEPASLAHAIEQCCAIKARVVGHDEREQGLRAILNFGHTFGHAIEAGLGFGVWLHGEAVAAGMVMAADLSERLGLMPAGSCARLSRLIARAGLPTRGPALGSAVYRHHMEVDKKSVDGTIRFVLLDGFGSACLQTAPWSAVEATLQACTV